MNADNKAILTQANALITQGDQEGFLSFCTDDVVWEFVGDQTLEGKHAIREYMKTAYAQPPRFNVEILIAENDYVTAIGKISLNNSNGDEINYAYCDVWEFSNGKMAKLKAFVIEKKD
jgi:uncharacterized protein